ncbi:MAG: hypothetical protein RIF37_01195 [Rhodospirillaceae bacterium]
MLTQSNGLGAFRQVLISVIIGCLAFAVAIALLSVLELYVDQFRLTKYNLYFVVIAVFSIISALLVRGRNYSLKAISFVVTGAINYWIGLYIYVFVTGNGP